MNNKPTATRKNNNLSQEVKNFLIAKGFHFLYNENDFKFFRSRTKNAINQAFEIAEMFISDSVQQSDFADYDY